MLVGFSGGPGAGKSLNAIKYIIENDDYCGMPVYYNGIRVLLFDYKVCDSFQGFLYGDYYPKNQHNKALESKLLKIEKEHRLATLEDFPYLAVEYSKHDPMVQFLTWFKKCASKKRLEQFNEALAVLEKSESDLTFEDVEPMNISWHQFEDPTKIHELPAGTVILVDEVQNIWPTRSASKKATQDIEFVTTHRHQGSDLVYVSQDFRDVDQMIRRRLAEFTYFEFIGGDFLYKYHDNNAFDPSSKADLAKVAKDKVKRDSKYYGVYLSAVKHTQKVKFSPYLKKAVMSGVMALFVIGVAIYFLLGSSLFASVFGENNDKSDVQTTESSSNAAAKSSKAKASLLDTSGDEFLNRFAPRHDALIFSAPIYDDLTANAFDYPKLTCVQISEDKCSCFTQQLTRYQIENAYCKSIAKSGFFDPFTSNNQGTQRSNRAPKNPDLNVGGVFQ